MTREETKNWLNKLYARSDITDEYGDMEDMQPYEEAVNMAIKALEQKPCEDVISRAEALKVVDDMDIPEDMSVFEIKSHISVEISTLPPATPKRKVGEWIKKNNDYFDWYECPECGYGSEGEMRYSREYDVRTKYCPNCGTQMQEVENEIN